MSPCTATREAPRYRRTEEVWALKIKDVKSHASGGADLFFSDPGYASIFVDAAFVRKHCPDVGRYYVIYPGNDRTIVSAEVFEPMFTLTTEAKSTGHLAHDVAAREAAEHDAENLEIARKAQGYMAFLRDMGTLLGCAASPTSVFIACQQKIKPRDEHVTWTYPRLESERSSPLDTARPPSPAQLLNRALCSGGILTDENLREIIRGIIRISREETKS